MFEAFKAGLIDFRVEDNVRRWRSEYDFPAVEGRAHRQGRDPQRPAEGRLGLRLQYAPAAFADPRVREALASMFDFEWINANLYAGAYRRSEGFFDDSELSSIGRPASERERALLAPFPGAVREDVMEGRWRAPASDGTGRDRAVARRAIDELERAGYALKDGRLVDEHGDAVRLRDHGQEPRGGAPCARLCPQPRPHRRRRRTSGSSTKCSSSGGERASTST